MFRGWPTQASFGLLSSPQYLLFVFAVYIVCNDILCNDIEINSLNP